MCRAHRLGQKREVNVYRLVAPAGTMEARVFQLQRRKELLVREVIQQRGVSVEAARLVAGAGDEGAKDGRGRARPRPSWASGGPAETAPPVPLQADRAGEAARRRRGGSTARRINPRLARLRAEHARSKTRAVFGGTR